VEIAPYMIGPARDAHDIYDDWARAREVEESGCVLVRPDQHVAWRANEVAEDAAAELGRVMESLLGVAAPVRGGSS
jgi:2,4-dichlorophenol 6-monooxygenase